jgi:D-sedoheptulose 7-phosphate isomerase
MSLTVDSSIITCIANDYGYEYIFSRQLQGVAIKGDTFVAFSTSGNSTNIIKALDVSNELGINTIAFLGRDGGACRDLADCSIIIPSYSTARIQEMHLFLGHYICRQVENNILIKE